MRRLSLVLLLTILGSASAFYFSGCKGGNFAPQPNYGYPTNTPTGLPTNTPTITSTPVPASPTPTKTPCGFPGLTCTPTATPPGWTFYSQSASTGWAYNANGSTAGVPVAVVFNGNPSPDCISSGGAIEVTIGFTNTNQQANIQYNIGTPTDFSGKTVSAVMSVPFGFTSNGPQGGYIYVQDGAPNYASAYSAYANLSSGCVTVSLAVPGASGNFDPTQITLVGVQVNSNGSVASSQTIVDIFDWLYQ